MRFVAEFFEKRHAVAGFGVLVHVALVGLVCLKATTPALPFDTSGLFFLSALVAVPWIAFTLLAPRPAAPRAARGVWNIVGLVFLALSSWAYWTRMVFPTGHLDPQQGFVFFFVPILALIAMVPIRLVIALVCLFRK